MCCRCLENCEIANASESGLSVAKIQSLVRIFLRSGCKKTNSLVAPVIFRLAGALAEGAHPYACLGGLNRKAQSTDSAPALREDTPGVRQQQHGAGWDSVSTLGNSDPRFPFLGRCRSADRRRITAQAGVALALKAYLGHLISLLCASF